MEKKHYTNQFSFNFVSLGVAADNIVSTLSAGVGALAGSSTEHQILKLQPSLEPKNDAEINRPEQNLDHSAGPSEIAIVSVLLEPVENKPTDKNDARRCDSDKAADQEAERSKRKSVNRAHVYPPPVPVLMRAALEAALRGRRHPAPWPSLNAKATNRPMRKRGRE